mmetsp:Transcript_14455/g.27776  ORF Transcript_14455/g.27776 Transcript_14455/m.27776 type:complete len:210 (-) Transcript_14455:245-874(-)|eukprot:CAMPEP_0114224688 /NCGR_PEP_ID=MMETSP0058-20121206/246_1 /TAXON_ID=36894 /ORGANISM="Pyramimonas parkeae, CCMP726" /LENGTH=209 /DNA_ID=CAMNT_0001335191 /DNA_START=77 /DNA_END=706 /DNA_ORIENTATION=-
MSKKKGVSLEDKRERILDVIQKSNTCWLLKDIEKVGPKLGVISQSVKDVVQSLVDDDLLLTDKVGISNWFWSFPSEVAHKLRVKTNALEPELQRLKKRKADLDIECKQAKAARPESSAREKSLKKLASLEEQHERLRAELEQHKENNPEHFNNLGGSIEQAHEGANRWTDNIFQLQKWCNNKFGGDSEKVKTSFKSLGVNLDDLEYLEE